MRCVTALDKPGLSSAIALYEAAGWQEQLQNAIRTPEALAKTLDLSMEALGYDDNANGSFALLVPRAFAARMRRGDPEDPLLLQVLPARTENDTVAGFNTDPVGELGLRQDPAGVLSKYSGRALLIATGHCAVNCRYCFRRHYPYSEDALSRSERLDTVRRLAADPALHELILSGGDPLLLSDGELSSMAELIAASPSIRTLRVHSRLPIVIPDRVTEGLIGALVRPGLQSVLVLHSNHPQEIDADTAAAIRRLRDAGITVLNQSVLLAGINDSASVLGELSDALFAAGALPYYLHLLDKVAGAAHFAVAQDRARRLVGEVAEQRPGYLVPRLVVELSGAGSKRELSPIYS
jgi:EF-P beta-lysylation protein EpmB